MYPVVDGGFRVAVLQVEWIHDEGLGQFEPVLDPHCGAVEVHQHPLVRVHIEAHGVLYACALCESEYISPAFLEYVTNNLTYTSMPFMRY